MLCYSPQSGSIAVRREPYLWRRRDGSVQRVFDVFGGVLFVDQLGPFAHYGVERGLCLGDVFITVAARGATGTHFSD